jgi:palmitoyl-protein thioesterase
VRPPPLFFRYTPAVQGRVSFANYWRDPMRLDKYRSASTFLADINNENPKKNKTYTRNLLSLDAMVLVRI